MPLRESVFLRESASTRQHVSLREHLTLWERLSQGSAFIEEVRHKESASIEKARPKKRSSIERASPFERVRPLMRERVPSSEREIVPWKTVLRKSVSKGSKRVHLC